MGILPEHLLNDEALRKDGALSLGKDPETFSTRDSKFNRKPLGCGPFVFRERWKSDQYIALDRFDGYSGRTSELQAVLLPDHPLTSRPRRWSSMQESAGAYGVQPHQVKRLEQHASGLSFGYTCIGYNMEKYFF